MKPVDLVTIEEKIPIFKDGEPANSIEVIRVKDSEGTSIQYDIISGKNEFNIGDKVIYIQPDYCIPQTNLFNDLYFPGNDPQKCKLGKRGRIKAIKFRFTLENGDGPIYSNGVVLPLNKVKQWIQQSNILNNQLKDEDFDGLIFGQIDENFPFEKVLGITKYVAEDSIDGSQKSGMTKGIKPSFLYKTDEETIQNHKWEVEKCFEANEVLSFTRKIDGSSITVYCKKMDGEWQVGICSRDLEKKLDQKYVSAYKNGEIILHPYLSREIGERGWYDDINQKFYSNDDVTQFEEIIQEQRDSWVDTCKKNNILEKLIDYCKKYDIELALRGELCGAGNKGTGKKHNQDAKYPESKIIWFGIDDLSSGHSKRINYANEHNLRKVCEELNFEYSEELFSGIFNYDECIKKASEYFNKMKDLGQIVEGVVVRTKYSNNLSVKIINFEYDIKT